jgi:hypothetical protein
MNEGSSPGEASKGKGLQVATLAMGTRGEGNGGRAAGMHSKGNIGWVAYKDNDDEEEDRRRRRIRRRKRKRHNNQIQMREMGERQLPPTRRAERWRWRWKLRR